MSTDWETQVTFTKSELETLDEVLRNWKLRWDQTNGGVHTPMRRDVSETLTKIGNAYALIANAYALVEMQETADNKEKK